MEDGELDNGGKLHNVKMEDCYLDNGGKFPNVKMEDGELDNGGKLHNVKMEDGDMGIRVSMGRYNHFKQDNPFLVRGKDPQQRDPPSLDDWEKLAKTRWLSASEVYTILKRAKLPIKKSGKLHWIRFCTWKFPKNPPESGSLLIYDGVKLKKVSGHAFPNDGY